MLETKQLARLRVGQPSSGTSDCRFDEYFVLHLVSRTKFEVIGRQKERLRAKQECREIQSYNLKTRIMALNPPPRCLFFDVFGTCVDWRKTVTDTLWNAAQAALKDHDTSMSTSVRKAASDMVRPTT